MVVILRMMADRAIKSLAYYKRIPTELESHEFFFGWLLLVCVSGFMEWTCLLLSLVDVIW